MLIAETASEILSKILKCFRWKANGGRDYVFYDSHPGFVAGHAAPTFVGMYCNEFRCFFHFFVITISYVD